MCHSGLRLGMMSLGFNAPSNIIRLDQNVCTIAMTSSGLGGLNDVNTLVLFLEHRVIICSLFQVPKLSPSQGLEAWLM
jgi:hypothetical protein